MKFSLRIVLLLFLVTGTLAQDLGFDLADAFDDDTPAPTQKPKEPPKQPEKPKTDGGFDLLDAFGPDPTVKPPKSGGGGGGGGGELDILDALGPDTNPGKAPRGGGGGGGGGGGTFDDQDLFDLGDKNYKPDGGRSGGDPGYDPRGGADQPQEKGSGQIAGIVSAVGVALLGAASSYFAYQKKKLCFKMQGGADPEMGKGHHGTYSEPQVLSNLLQTN